MTTSDLVFEFLKSFLSKHRIKHFRMVELVSYDQDIVNGRFTINYRYYKDFISHRDNNPTYNEVSLPLLDYITFVYVKAANYSPRVMGHGPG